MFRLARRRAQARSHPLSHDDPSSIAPPEAIGPYRVLHQIGSGVLGPVFRAVDPDGDRIVAVKLFRLDWPPEQARALAGALETLIETLPAHESLVRPLAAGLEAGSAWLAQDFIGADGLEARLRRRTPVHAEEAVRLLRQVASGLDAAAEAGWRHGALHPRDILVDTSGHVRVTGVGVAQVVERFGARSPRRRPYTAPERAVAAGWDTRADVFALATIASEMLGPRRSRGHSDDLRVAAFSEAGFDGRRAIAVLNRGMSNVAGERQSTATALVDALEDTVGPADAGSDAVGAAAEEDGAARGEASLFDLQEPDAPREPEVEPPVVVAVAETADALDAFDVAIEPGAQKPGAAVPAAWEFPLADQGPAVQAPRADEADQVPPPRARMWEPGPDQEPAAGSTPDVPFGLQPPTERGTPWGVLAAVLVVGLAIGFLLGRWSARLASPSGVAPPSATAPLERAEVQEEPMLGTQPPAPVPQGAARATPPPPAASTAPVSPAPAPKPPAASKAAPPARQQERPQPPPQRARGRLLVRTSPAGARVKVDGKDRGVTPLALRDLDVGDVTVELTRPGYAPESRRVRLTERRPAQTLEVRLRSTTAASAPAASGVTSAPSATGRASLELASRPSGARVFVDGQPVGTTPLRLVDVAPGPKSIRFELAGHARWTASVTVAPGEARRVTASLEPEP